MVFVTHPPCVSEEGSHRPNFWHGNVTLPRVAQWKDALIAIHNLPDDDWMGFTHAYFPLYAFDEHALRDGWAFARKGAGYLALTAAQGLALTTQGDNAYRELRSAWAAEHLAVPHGPRRARWQLRRVSTGGAGAAGGVRWPRGQAAPRCAARRWPLAGRGRCC